MLRPSGKISSALTFRVNLLILAVEASSKASPGKQLMPGVVARCSHFTERHELIAERPVTYGRRVGRENITAGTDCGPGTRVGQGAIAVAKFQTLAEGVQQASQRPWHGARAGAITDTGKPRRQLRRKDPRT
jgi:hypothetical protein